MGRGDYYQDWPVLAGEFPPTLDKETDPTALPVGASPDAYGISWEEEGRLKSGSVPTGTARSAPVGTGDGSTWNYYYERLWKASTTNMQFRAKYYTDALFKQGLGNLAAAATIVTFMPALGNAMWVATATGSHLIRDANDQRDFMELSEFNQAVVVATANRAITLNGTPFFCNTTGVFSWDGNGVKEWTRAVRNNLGSFSDQPILANYNKRAIIGTSKFVIDTEGGKLFDYGTSGFRFTTRTFTDPGPDGGTGSWSPFKIEKVAFALEFDSSGTAAEIGWQTQFEDDAWVTQDTVLAKAVEGKKTWVEASIPQEDRAAHKFRLRITSLTSTLAIREIRVLPEMLRKNAFVK